MNTSTLLSLAAIGFLGGSHCAAMCGGLSSAFVLQLPNKVSRNQLILLLNSGRLISYTLIGALVGALGQFGLLLDHTHQLQNGLFVAANLLLLFIGLYLAGIYHGVMYIEKIGKPIWQKLNPLLGRLLPLQSAPAAFAAGMLWGWLPCGLVYSASLYALGSANATQGALYMLAFGLGTLPNLLAIGYFAKQLNRFIKHRFIRLLSGLIICAVALWHLWHAFIH